MESTGTRHSLATIGVQLTLLALPLALAAQDPGAHAPSLEDARARLAVIDGSVALPGLDSGVEVRRDSAGVPHIYAKTTHDLFLAQGYVAAQDRLWQMDMWRRIGEGRPAEVLGPSMVERDRFARMLRYRGDMAAEWRSYAPDTREIVRSFIQGVNAYIAQVRDHPPIEYTILGFAPEPFAEDVPLQRMAALSMTGNATSEVARAQLVKLLGAGKVQQLLPPDPFRRLDPIPGLDLSGINAGSLGPAIASLEPVAYHRLEGSNDWVVSGKRTATGKPLLANDPHRTIALPSLRYLTHLVGPGWNVIGAGEPALPGVAAGHNERVGFGFTIVGMDQQDVYVERVGACRGKSAAAARAARCYLNHGEWKPIRILVDTIPVKGEPPRVVQLQFTQHGPIVSEDAAHQRAFALRFVGTEPGTAGYLASLSIDRATNWKSFRDAAAHWKLPTENLVYADVDGNIGWIAAGLMPVRSWSGLLPVPGDGRFEWRGFLGIDDLPQSYNPASGMIVTANNNILPRGYSKPLNYEWAPADRAGRITELLRAGSGFGVADFERIQHDELDVHARSLVPILIAAAAGAQRSPEIDTIATWDFVMRKDAMAPLLFGTWEDLIAEKLFALHAGPKGAMLGEQEEIGLIEDELRHPDAMFGAHPAQTRDSLVLAAFSETISSLTMQLGADRSHWRWGLVHHAPFHHPLAKSYDLPDAPRGGDGSTVNATPGPGFLQTHGASFREVLDFADWDSSVGINTPGQSGQPGSEYYGNLLPLWRDGQYFPLLFSRERVVKATAHLLMLEPAPIRPQ